MNNKLTKSFFWSFAENWLFQVVNFLIGIILARILAPKDFGLIGIVSFFTAISGLLIDSGFRQSLIRRKDISNEEYSSVFFFNLVIASSLYLILYLAAGYISVFFKESVLKSLIRVLSVVLFINSLTLVQLVILVKDLDFKKLAKITAVSSVFSGICGILAAYWGMGFWSLVIKQLLFTMIRSILLWFNKPWRPSFLLNMSFIRENLSFGYKLLAASLLDVIYKNIYSLVIGKFFTATELGYYNRADQFSKFSAINITGSVERVLYPHLSNFQDDIDLVKVRYKKVLKTTALFIFTLMLVIIATADNLIVLLIGEKWLPALPYLKLLCVAGLFIPLNELSMSILKVKGRSNLYLKNEIIKKTLIIPFIVFGIYWGIKVLICGLILQSFIAYLINVYYLKRILKYEIIEQIKDLVPALAISTILLIILLTLDKIIDLEVWKILLLQLVVGFIMFLILCHGFKIKELSFVYTLLLPAQKQSGE
jgi:teichuronic acid exporter